MFARLWWKDARQFWPIWGVLVLAAAATEWLIIAFVGPQADYFFLGYSALMWATLYALAAGAAAFAGEREVGTLGLLDALPVDRRVVWRSKVSFALVTTVLLTLLLQLIALLGVQEWNSRSSASVWGVLVLGPAVLVALGWSLFWSSVFPSALGAAMTAIVCTGFSFSYLGGFDFRIGELHPFLEIVLTLATVAASNLAFTRTVRPRWLRLDFRSPVVVTPSRPTGSPRVPLQAPSAAVPVREPRPFFLPVVETRERSTTDPVPGRSWIVEVRHLTWQTIKEGIKSWCLLAMLAVVYFTLSFGKLAYLDPIWFMLVSIGVTLAAGVNVFELENRTRTQRFLAYHGARPGLVWLVKLAVWSAALAMIWGPLAVIAFSLLVRDTIRIEWLPVVTTFPLLFTVALLCGMAIPRGITAFVIAIVIAAGLETPLLALVAGRMLPAQGILFVPLVLLAVSWAWRNDWMLDRPAPGRWLRLGLFLSAGFGLLATGYVAFRIESVRDVGPISPPAPAMAAGLSPIRPDRNAAELYREAEHRMVNLTDSTEFLNQNRQILDLICQAAARPECRFNQSEKQTLVDRDHSSEPPYVEFSRLVALDVRHRQDRNDLGGAWNDITVMFRMARHFSELRGHFPGVLARVAVEREALGLAMEWAVAKGQTSEQLEDALAAYRDLPKLTPVADAIRAEAKLVEKTLDMPVSELRDWLIDTNIAAKAAHTDKVMAYLGIDMVTTRWECARARRVNRLIAKKAIETAMHEPVARPRLKTGNLEQDDPEIEYALRTTPLAKLSLFPSVAMPIETDDRNEVGRRAFVQVLAIRAWQLRHGGRFPDRLDALVPAELPSLPRDPYTGRSFGYVKSQGQPVLPLRDVLTASISSECAPTLIRAAGSWLLYSGGPELKGPGRAAFTQAGKVLWRDLVFAIPPVEKSDIPPSTKGK